MSATGTLAKLQFEIPRSRRSIPQEIATLRTELGTLADTQPTEQLDALLQKRQSLINVLQRRLDAGELTYARYLATSQQVFSLGARQPAARSPWRPRASARSTRPTSTAASPNSPTTTATRIAEPRAGHARTAARAASHPTPQDRPTAGAERVRAHRARPHHDRPRRRTDRQEARGRRCGDGRTRRTRRPDRRLCDLNRCDLIRRTEPREGPDDDQRPHPARPPRSNLTPRRAGAAPNSRSPSPSRPTRCARRPTLRSSSCCRSTRPNDDARDGGPRRCRLRWVATCRPRSATAAGCCRPR